MGGEPSQVDAVAETSNLKENVEVVCVQDCPLRIIHIDSLIIVTENLPTSLQSLCSSLALLVSLCLSLDCRSLRGCCHLCPEPSRWRTFPRRKVHLTSVESTVAYG